MSHRDSTMLSMRRRRGWDFLGGVVRNMMSINPSSIDTVIRMERSYSRPLRLGYFQPDMPACCSAYDGEESGYLCEAR